MVCPEVQSLGTSLCQSHHPVTCSGSALSGITDALTDSTATPYPATLIGSFVFLSSGLTEPAWYELPAWLAAMIRFYGLCNRRTCFLQVLRNHDRCSLDSCA